MRVIPSTSGSEGCRGTSHRDDASVSRRLSGWLARPKDDGRATASERLKALCAAAGQRSSHTARADRRFLRPIGVGCPEIDALRGDLRALEGDPRLVGHPSHGVLDGSARDVSATAVGPALELDHAPETSAARGAAGWRVPGERLARSSGNLRAWQLEPRKRRWRSSRVASSSFSMKR
jgi:hypothetical protein